MRRVWLGARKWTAISALGGSFVLGGCDPTVRDTVLSGVEGASTVLTTTLLQAFFESLVEDEDDVATVVQGVRELADAFA